MVERNINSTNDKSLNINESGLDLSPVNEREPFHQTVHFLNRSKTRFEKENWRGGIGKEVNFDNVIEMLTDIRTGEVDPKQVPANEQLAFIEALQFTGIEIKRGLVDFLKIKARQESSKTIVQVSKNELGQIKRRHPSLSSTAIRLAIAGLAASGAWYAIKNADGNFISNAGNRLQTNNEQTNFDIPSHEPDILDNQAQNRSFSLNGVFEGLAETIPSVTKAARAEDLPSNLENYNLWGINFTPVKEHGEDTEIVLTWEGGQINATNDERALEIIIRPEVEAEKSNLPLWDCLLDPSVDCTAKFDNFILVGGHSGTVNNTEGKRIILAMEPIRGYIEGHKILENGSFSNSLSNEERQDRMHLLEESGATLKQDNHEVRVQAAVVRIEEADRDNLYSDWSRASEAALKYNPEIGSQINLESPYLVIATSGRKLAGDELSGHNHYPYTSSVILIFLGEASRNN